MEQSNSKTPIIEAKKLYLGYNRETIVINNANFTINAGDFVFITGQSGSGKSTLLRSLYGDMKISSGELCVCDKNLSSIKAKDLQLLRRNIGVVFQNYRLVNEWNIHENVVLPLKFCGLSESDINTRAYNLLRHVRLNIKAERYPKELSGGEQQRVALARAIGHNPALLLCDEPTGNLDDYSSSIVWDLLGSLRNYWNVTIVVVTHKKPTSMPFKFREFQIKEGKVNEKF